MSHTNSTINYSLPQFVTTDKPAWLTDVNNAYLAIDTAMKNNADAASTADTKATNAGTAASAADTKATSAKSAADGAIASIASAFSDTDTYQVGAIVTYNNLLYVCSTAVYTPGAWTGSTNWTRITVQDEIDAVKADITSVASDIPSFNITTKSDNTSVTSGSIAKTINATTLTAGTYIVVTRFTFATTSTTGTLKGISGTGATDIVNQRASSEVGGHSGGYTQIDQVSMFTLGAQTNLYAKASQTTGSSITVYADFIIMKIS